MVRSKLQNFFQDQLGTAESQQTVLDVGTAREWKCEACLAGELIEFADGSFGRALNLAATSQVEMIPGGDSYRGRIVNALGAPVDGLGQIDKGRAGIIGDRQTGKTTVAVDAILNQTDVVCVYVAVGQKTSTIAEMISSLSQTKDMTCVVVVLSGADEASTLQIAPLVLLFLDQKADLGQMQANQHERVAANDAGRLNGDVLSDWPKPPKLIKSPSTESWVAIPRGARRRCRA